MEQTRASRLYDLFVNSNEGKEAFSRAHDDIQDLDEDDEDDFYANVHGFVLDVYGEFESWLEERGESELSPEEEESVQEDITAGLT